MNKLTPLLLGALLLAGCPLPSRDNPADPTNLEPPEIRLTQVEAFNCRQWLFPFVSRYDELQDAIDISADERDEIDAFCDARCPTADPGGPPADPSVPWVPNECHNSLIYAGIIGVEENVEARCDAPRVISVRELALRGDAPSTVDVIAYAQVNESVDVPLLATTDADAGELRTITIPAYNDVTTEVDAGYPGVTTLMTAPFRALHSEGVLLTRSLDSVDRFLIEVVLSATRSSSAVEQRSDCELSFRFEQTLESYQHPLGLAGGYGRTVSIGDLDLELDGPGSSSGALEIATSYGVSAGVCFADLVYRDAATRARHWGYDGHAPIPVPCRADGEPPQVVIGRFLDPVDEALAVPAFNGVTHRIDFWATGSAYTIVRGASAEYADASTSGPDRMVDVGDVSGDGRDDIAVVSADRSVASICSAPTPPSTSSLCEPLPAATCDGSAVNRILDIAEAPHGLVVPAIAMLAQSTNRTCVLEWQNQGSGFTVSRETVFPARPDEAVVHWTAGTQGILPVVVGAVGPYPELIVHDVDPAAAPARSYSLVDVEGEGCDTPLVATGNRVGASATGVPSLVCGASGCTYESGRILGLPGFDLVPAQGGMIADGGATAVFDPALCGSGAYVLRRFSAGNVAPTTFGASVSSRPDVRRGRRELDTAGSRCVVPPVIAVGAPAGGSFGGAGHVIVLYPQGAPLENPSCTDVAWP